MLGGGRERPRAERADRGQRRVNGDWATAVATALADLERACGDAQIGAVVLVVLCTSPNQPSRWIVSSLKHHALVAGYADLLMDAADAARASGLERAAALDRGDA
jgi:hypothetical protein